MRIVANENVSSTVIRELRQRGHDVLSVKESMRGSSDEHVLAMAQRERRLILTHDKDFGELAIRLGLPADGGVILLRLTGADRERDNRRAVEAIQGRTDWPGHFAAVTDDQVRMRPLPKGRGKKRGPE